jgi:hypothetical protein
MVLVLGTDAPKRVERSPGLMPSAGAALLTTAPDVATFSSVTRFGVTGVEPVMIRGSTSTEAVDV